MQERAARQSGRVGAVSQAITEMRLCVYRTLWGVLADCDGEKAGSPFQGVQEALQEIARCLLELWRT